MMINFFYNISRIVRWILKYYGGLNKNGLVPSRQQVIVWTDDDPMQWCIYAPPALMT